MGSLKKLALAFVVVLATCASAFAQEAPDKDVQLSTMANQTVRTCLEAMSAGLAGLSNETKVLMLTTMADTCRKTAVVVQSPQAPSLGDKALTVLERGLGLYFGYKGQGLIWGAVGAIANKGLSTAESIAGKGIDAAGKDPLIVQPVIVEVPVPAE